MLHSVQPRPYKATLCANKLSSSPTFGDSGSVLLLSSVLTLDHDRTTGNEYRVASIYINLYEGSVGKQPVAKLERKYAFDPFIDLGLGDLSAV